jgi:L-ascorbate metabolism protein UlaG (beta-lactamase superfamily)
MNPEETVRAAQDVHAKQFIPIHWGKFTLSLHAWDESIVRVTNESKRLHVPIIHPMIGEKICLGDSVVTSNWWETVK